MASQSMTLKNLQKQAGGHTEKPKMLTMADFLSKEAMQEHMETVRVSRKSQRKTFDSVDAFCAEIIARFGFETYEKWNNGEISTDKVSRLLAAERSREYAKLTQLEAVILASVSSAVRRYKGEPKPRGLENANRIIKENYKIIKGIM